MAWQKLVEGILKNLNEDTVSGNIVYFPGSFTTVRQTILNLGGLKSKWKLKILKNENDYGVDFENQLKIIVPKEHYQHFNVNVLKIDGVKEVNLSKIFQEAITVNFQDLINTFILTLRKIPSILNSLELMNTWISNFSNSQFLSIPEKILINLQRYDRSVMGLMGKIKEKYGGDKGYIEQLITTIEENRPLSNIDYINQFSYLVGCRIQSQYEGIKLQLDLFVNLALQSTQVITVDELDIAMELKFYKDVKVVKNKIYPLSGTFRPYIFDALKDIIIDFKHE